MLTCASNCPWTLSPGVTWHRERGQNWSSTAHNLWCQMLVRRTSSVPWLPLSVFLHVMHNLTTLCMADLPLGIQNFSLKCTRMWFCPACNNFWFKLAISSWATWCFGGAILGNLASNAIGASAMRPPTLMVQPSNMGQSSSILFEGLTWPLVS